MEKEFQNLTLKNQKVPKHVKNESKLENYKLIFVFYCLQTACSRVPSTATFNLQQMKVENRMPCHSSV